MFRIFSITTIGQFTKKVIPRKIILIPMAFEKAGTDCRAIETTKIPNAMTELIPIDLSFLTYTSIRKNTRISTAMKNKTGRFCIQGFNLNSFCYLIMGLHYLLSPVGLVLLL
jgi:hypothetical protein